MATLAMVTRRRSSWNNSALLLAVVSDARTDSVAPPSPCAAALPGGARCRVPVERRKLGRQRGGTRQSRALPRTLLWWNLLRLYRTRLAAHVPETPLARQPGRR